MKSKFFLKGNKIPQALIVRQAPLSNINAFLKSYLKALVCMNDSCGECYWCKKIDAGKYFDIEILDGKNLKKAELQNVVERFARSGVEETGIRVYVIKDIEYASNKILNSLLKFVEEPPKGVYAVFTTRNYNAIIPTIRSRCFSVYLSQDEEGIEEFFNGKNLIAFDKKLICSCFYTIEDMKEKYDQFMEYYELIKKLTSKDRLFYANDGLNLFKKITYEDISLFLNIVKSLFKEISLQIIDIQDNLYLNTNKTLIYAKVYDLLSGVRKVWKQ